jgi:hypothetical protein
MKTDKQILEGLAQALDETPRQHGHTMLSDSLLREVAAELRDVAARMGPKSLPQTVCQLCHHSAPLGAPAAYICPDCQGFAYECKAMLLDWPK